jgi:amino acid transporter
VGGEAGDERDERRGRAAAGGQYVFLSEAFSPLFGFLYGRTLLFAINTSIVAAVAVAFVKTLGFFVPGAGEEHALVAVLGTTFTTAQLVPRADRGDARSCRSCSWRHPSSSSSTCRSPTPGNTGPGLLLPAAGVPAHLCRRRHR